MLLMKQLGKVFHTGEVSTHALREVDLAVQEGDFVSVTGPSGSGKTTFLNIAGLLEVASSGVFLLDGENVNQQSDSQRSKMRNQKIGFIFQGFNLIPELNLFDNVDVPLRYRGFDAKERKRRIEQQLELVGLASRMKHLPSQLSGGQQQRVAIARALATSPRFLLADEPTGNLDSQMAQSVMALLEDINRQGTTIIMVTHDHGLAQRAKRQILIKDGRVSELTTAQHEPLQHEPLHIVSPAPAAHATKFAGV
jgi:putative ABC transport system ATP-binding protein